MLQLPWLWLFITMKLANVTTSYKSSQIMHQIWNIELMFLSEISFSDTFLSYEEIGVIQDYQSINTILWNSQTTVFIPGVIFSLNSKECRTKYHSTKVSTFLVAILMIEVYFGLDTDICT